MASRAAVARIHGLADQSLGSSIRRISAATGIDIPPMNGGVPVHPTNNREYFIARQKEAYAAFLIQLADRLDPEGAHVSVEDPANDIAPETAGELALEGVAELDPDGAALSAQLESINYTAPEPIENEVKQ